MNRLVVASVFVLAASRANADTTAARVTALFENLTSIETSVDDSLAFPHFAITNDDVSNEPTSWGSLRYPTGLPQVSKAKQPVVGVAADGQAAWIGTDLALVKLCQKHPDDDTGDLDHYAPDYCKVGDPAAWLHGAALFEHVGDRWQPIVWHVGGRQAGGNYEGATPTQITRQIEKGAEDVASRFETTIADPAAFAKTISDRSDVAMFGSERAERFVGAATVRSTLTSWNLSFHVIDGVRAGITANKTVAWVVANLEATSRAKPKSAATRYRAMLVYEREGAVWHVVQLSFSAMPPTSVRSSK